MENARESAYLRFHHGSQIGVYSLDQVRDEVTAALELDKISLSIQVNVLGMDMTITGTDKTPQKALKEHTEDMEKAKEAKVQFRMKLLKEWGKSIDRHAMDVIGQPLVDANPTVLAMIKHRKENVRRAFVRYRPAEIGSHITGATIIFRGVELNAENTGLTEDDLILTCNLHICKTYCALMHIFGTKSCDGLIECLRLSSSETSVSPYGS